MESSHLVGSVGYKGYCSFEDDFYKHKDSSFQFYQVVNSSNILQCKDKNNSFVQLLSVELLHKAFSLLSFQDFPNISCVCKLWNQVINSEQILRSWFQQEKIPLIFLEEMKNIKEAYRAYQLDSNWNQGKYRELTLGFRDEKAVSFIWGGNAGVLLTSDKKMYKNIYHCTIWKLNKNLNEIFSLTFKNDPKENIFNPQGFGVENNVFYYVAEKLEKVSKKYFQNLTHVDESKKHFYSANLTYLNEERGPHVKIFHQKPITHVAIGEERFATRDETGIYIWNKEDLKLVHFISDKEGSYDKSLHIWQNLLIFQQEKESLQIWDLSAFSQQFSITDFNKILALSNELIIIEMKKAKTIQFWSFKTREIRNTFNLNKVYSCFSCKYEKFGLGAQDGTILIWDLSNFNVVLDQQIQESPIRSLEFLPNWKFVTGSEKGYVKVWNIEGKLLYSLQKSSWRKSVQQLVSNNDCLFALFKDKTVKAWIFDNSKKSYPSEYESIYSEICNSYPEPREIGWWTD